MIEIRQATAADLPLFFQYLAKQLEENGANNTPLFQPLSRSKSQLSDDMRIRFAEGIVRERDQAGWRQLWIAMDNGQVLGHIDIRATDEPYTEHRALMGIGVDASARQQGLGKRLIDHLFSDLASQLNFGDSIVERIDLWVLSHNQAAKNLYLSMGFKLCGELTDMFRIDGQSLDHTLMSRLV
ncbi:GNAT family N-acetyltransferase [Shewanella sp. Scap07]|uniref:GNAT family N-acetyltransferase n=1 Tax=Shewanella sp. Scap07 TaxID=2589987 RepID=UPI002118ED45|nr:GNAT family protein [Shewanella sp. Scap07]